MELHGGRKHTRITNPMKTNNNLPGDAPDEMTAPEMPDGLPALPPIPEGFDRWKFRRAYAASSYDEARIVCRVTGEWIKPTITGLLHEYAIVAVRDAGSGGKPASGEDAGTPRTDGYIIPVKKALQIVDDYPRVTAYPTSLTQAAITLADGYLTLERELAASEAKVKALTVERDNALSDFKQAATDSIRALHERNTTRAAAEKMRDGIVDTARKHREAFEVARPIPMQETIKILDGLLAAYEAGKEVGQ